MTVIAHMATYPARAPLLRYSIGSIADQVDRVRVVLNGFDWVPDDVAAFANVEPIIPSRDLKDVGKFLPDVAPDDTVVLCDDDIIYPPDYVATLAYYRDRFADLDAVVGLHGVIYSDFFDGDIGARAVLVFDQELRQHTAVNQLGTGTVMVPGRHMPPLDFMAGSERFVDVRFAIHAARKGIPLVALKRPAGWLTAIDEGDGIFQTFTARWPLPVIREAQEIAGFSRLNLRAVEVLAQMQPLPPGARPAAEAGPA